MCNQNLEEVVLIAGGSTDAGISVTNIYFNGPSGGGDFNDAEETISWIAGGESGGGFEDEEKEDDWIRDHIEELCSDTNSTNNSSQNFSIEEPRWGQLANKEEILDEIAKVIEKTNGLAPVPQMMALKKHFGANLRFNPRTNTPFIEEDNIDVNRYVYTTEGGWLDFNHVFAAFNLTYDVGVHYALLGGKVMEEIQAMRENNHSAYAYEDLTSNYVGTYMFTKYWDDISDGNITYEKMVSEILDELGVVDPEDAPNFDYIPAYMDSNYPKNYSFKPITGNDLLEAAKKAFCNKDEKDKIKNIKARENYKR
ncbi:hypothetical protein EGM88_12700 [Aureibaculum marinum]|uniref:Uncharacterized protein n=2 Tax=Aureibaculum marinum TaxID=2487930 RepID=A0A3N4NLG3_9FLAO|nr:hypothetical protein EGM88_12700 [Aureibaculum marinum]